MVTSARDRPGSDTMIEIRIHGRGGQGGVTLAKLIAPSRFLQGLSVQAFGLYAAERSGAPIQAFCRYSEDTITNRNLIYEPDHIIVLDPTLIGPAVTAGLKAGGWILFNSEESPDYFAADFGHFRIATVDATRIARDNKLGTRSVPIVNTALAGAVGKMLGFPLEEIEAALQHLGFVDGNLKAAATAYEQGQFIDAPSDTRRSGVSLQPRDGRRGRPGSTQHAGRRGLVAARDQDRAVGHRAAASAAVRSAVQSHLPCGQQRAGFPERAGA